MIMMRRWWERRTYASRVTMKRMGTWKWGVVHKKSVAPWVGRPTGGNDIWVFYTRC